MVRGQGLIPVLKLLVAVPLIGLPRKVGADGWA